MLPDMLCGLTWGPQMELLGKVFEPVTRWVQQNSSYSWGLKEEWIILKLIVMTLYVFHLIFWASLKDSINIINIINISKCTMSKLNQIGNKIKLVFFVGFFFFPYLLKFQLFVIVLRNSFNTIQRLFPVKNFPSFPFIGPISPTHKSTELQMLHYNDVSLATCSSCFVGAFIKFNLLRIP